MNNQKECKKCLFDSTIPDIKFDRDGVCNFCRLQEKIDNSYPIGSGEKRLQVLLYKIKKESRNKKFNCVVPISGGADSSYVLYKIKQYGLKPLAFTYDNGWLTQIARDNISKLVNKLDIEHRFVEFPWEQWKDLYLAALKASVPEVCLPCQMACYSLMYKIAAQENIKYVFWGLSPRTEGIGPLKIGYADSLYLKDIVEKFCSQEGKLLEKQINKCKFKDFFYYTFLKKIKIIQLPLYLQWNDVAIKEELKLQISWEDGGEKHFDCSYKQLKKYILYKKFGINLNKISLSALVRNSDLNKNEAKISLETEEQLLNKQKLDSILVKLGLTNQDLDKLINSKKKFFCNYKSYYTFLKNFRFIIFLLSKIRILPETAYLKFFNDAEKK